MCVYCYSAVGALVGAAAIAKVGGLASVKAGLSVLANHLLFFRR